MLEEIVKLKIQNTSSERRHQSMMNLCDAFKKKLYRPSISKFLKGGTLRSVNAILKPLNLRYFHWNVRLLN